MLSHFPHAGVWTGVPCDSVNNVHACRSQLQYPLHDTIHPGQAYEVTTLAQ